MPISLIVFIASVLLALSCGLWLYRNAVRYSYRRGYAVGLAESQRIAQIFQAKEGLKMAFIDHFGTADRDALIDRFSAPDRDTPTTDGATDDAAPAEQVEVSYYPEFLFPRTTRELTLLLHFNPEVVFSWSYTTPELREAVEAGAFNYAVDLDNDYVWDPDRPKITAAEHVQAFRSVLTDRAASPKLWADLAPYFRGDQGAGDDETVDAAGETPTETPRFSTSNIPAPDAGWADYRKVSITRAVKIDGPFVVETSEGPLSCEDGYLAIDARGYPYPIATDEFVQIYVPAEDYTPAPEPVAQSVPPTERYSGPDCARQVKALVEDGWAVGVAIDWVAHYTGRNSSAVRTNYYRYRQDI